VVTLRGNHRSPWSRTAESLGHDQPIRAVTIAEIRSNRGRHAGAAVCGKVASQLRELFEQAHGKPDAAMEFALDACEVQPPNRKRGYLLDLIEYGRADAVTLCINSRMIESGHSSGSLPKFASARSPRLREWILATSAVYPRISLFPSVPHADDKKWRSLRPVAPGDATDLILRQVAFPGALFRGNRKAQS
jgi:hypothetical protein